MTPRRVLLIILDSAEKTLLERWMRSGDLPNLTRLCERGAYGPLDSLSQVMNATTWPTFTTGVWPGDHGISHYLMWRPDKMAFQRPTSEWVPYNPFWQPLTTRGRKVVALDLPYSHLAIHPPDSIELRSWGTHYKFETPQSHPPDLMKTIARRFGRQALGPQRSGLKRTRDLLPLRPELLASVKKQMGAARLIMESHPWDLFMINFGAPHLGGHDFWDTSNLLDTPSEAESELLATTLRDIYRACDQAVGELVKTAGEQTTVVVMSLYGMGTNNSLVDVLPDMLRRVLGYDSEEITADTGVLQNLRGRVPLHWRSAFKSRLPGGLQDWLSGYWRGISEHDWAQTEAFCPLPDYQGFVRLNLRGREAQGIVSPGEDYDRLWQTISTGLQTFLDADTGQHIIEAINAPDQLFPLGDRTSLLPDMIVNWSGVPAQQIRAVHSPEFGTIPWPTPGRTPDGQSGHHISDGWLLAAGPAIEPGSTLENAHMIDVPPTLYRLLDEPVPAHLRGRVLSLPGLELGQPDR